MGVNSIEIYRTDCGCAGYLITFSGGSTHAINAYGCGDCNNCRAACPLCDATSADYVCGWDEADALLKRLFEL